MDNINNTSGSTTSMEAWSVPTLIKTTVYQNRVEIIYKEVSNVILTVGVFYDNSSP